MYIQYRIPYAQGRYTFIYTLLYKHKQCLYRDTSRVPQLLRLFNYYTPLSPLFSSLLMQYLAHAEYSTQTSKPRSRTLIAVSTIHDLRYRRPHSAINGTCDNQQRAKPKQARNERLVQYTRTKWPVAVRVFLIESVLSRPIPGLDSVISRCEESRKGTIAWPHLILPGRACRIASYLELPLRFLPMIFGLSPPPPSSWAHRVCVWAWWIPEAERLWVDQSSERSREGVVVEFLPPFNTDGGRYTGMYVCTEVLCFYGVRNFKAGVKGRVICRQGRGWSTKCISYIHVRSMSESISSNGMSKCVYGQM